MRSMYLIFVVLVSFGAQLCGISYEEQAAETAYKAFVATPTMENYKVYAQAYNAVKKRDYKLQEDHLKAIKKLFENNLLEDKFKAGYRKKMLTLILNIIPFYAAVQKDPNKVDKLWKEVGELKDELDPSFQPPSDITKQPVAFALDRAKEYLLKASDEGLSLDQRFQAYQEAFKFLINVGKIDQNAREELVKTELLIDERILKEHPNEEVWLQAVKTDMDGWQEYFKKYPISETMSEQFFGIYGNVAKSLSKVITKPTQQVPQIIITPAEEEVKPIKQKPPARVISVPMAKGRVMPKGAQPPTSAKPAAKKAAATVRNPLLESLKALNTRLTELKTALEA